MKKIILVICAMVSVMAVSSYIFAAQPDVVNDDQYIEMGGYTEIPIIDADKIPYGNASLNKLSRGLLNGATFWTEIPAEVCKVSKEKDALQGGTIGFVQGTVTSVVRLGTAIFDTVTFFIPPYDKPVMRPEYAFQRADQEIKDYLW